MPDPTAEPKIATAEDVERVARLLSGFAAVDYCDSESCDDVAKDILEAMGYTLGASPEGNTHA